MLVIAWTQLQDTPHRSRFLATKGFRLFELFGLLPKLRPACIVLMVDPHPSSGGSLSLLSSSRSHFPYNSLSIGAHAYGLVQAVSLSCSAWYESHLSSCILWFACRQSAPAGI